MSEQSHDPLDVAIDRAAQQMVAADTPGALEGAVVSRLAAAERADPHRWIIRGGLAVAGAAVLLVAVWWEVGSPPDQRQAAAVESRDAVVGREDAPPPAPSPAHEAQPEVTAAQPPRAAARETATPGSAPGPRSGVKRGSGTATARAVLESLVDVPASEDLPPVDPIVISSMRLEPIRVEQIALAPLPVPSVDW